MSRILVALLVTLALPATAFAGDLTGVWSVSSTDGSSAKTLWIFPKDSGGIPIYDETANAFYWAGWVSGLEGTQFTWTWGNGSVAKATLAKDGENASLGGAVSMSRVNKLDASSAAAGTWKTAVGSTVVVSPVYNGKMQMLFKAPSQPVRDWFVPLQLGGTWNGTYWASKVIEIKDNPFEVSVQTDQGGSFYTAAASWSNGTQFTFYQEYNGSCTGTVASDGSRRIDLACSTGSMTWTGAANWTSWTTFFAANWVAGLEDVQLTFNGCTGSIPAGGSTMSIDGCGGGSWTRSAPWPVAAASAPTAAANTIAGKWRDDNGNFWTVPQTTSSPFDVRFDASDGRSMNTFSANWASGLQGMQFVIVFSGDYYDECTFTFNAANPSQLAGRCSASGEFMLQRVP